MPLDQATILSQLDLLLSEYGAMVQRAKYDDLSDIGTTGLESMAGRFQSALNRWTTPGSSYQQQAERVGAKDAFLRLPVLAGTVQSLRDDVAAGWMVTIRELIHADAFADLLEQATELLSKGYKDAAAVVAGCTLESHLRNLCVKCNVTPSEPSGKSKSADKMRTDLVKVGCFNQLIAASVLSWLTLRNSAAHGNYADYTSAQVDSMIRDVRGFISNHPA
jgi:hypothetical protein